MTVNTGKTTMDTMMMNAHTNTTVKTYQFRTTIGKIADYNFSFVHRALRRIDMFKFNILRGYFPNLKSFREFITDNAYLRGISLLIESRDETPVPTTLFEACMTVLTKIGGEISAIKETYEGTTDFTDKKFSEVFRSKTLHITDPHGEGEGVSQNASAIRPEWKIDLGTADWFVFNDNFGTTEEKAFVAYFATYVEKLKREYEKVYLVRWGFPFYNQQNRMTEFATAFEHVLP